MKATLYQLNGWLYLITNDTVYVLTRRRYTELKAMLPITVRVLGKQLSSFNNFKFK